MLTVTSSWSRCSLGSPHTHTSARNLLNMQSGSPRASLGCHLEAARLQAQQNINWHGVSIARCSSSILWGTASLPLPRSRSRAGSSRRWRSSCLSVWSVLRLFPILLLLQGEEHIGCAFHEERSQEALEVLHSVVRVLQAVSVQESFVDCCFTFKPIP